MARLAAFDVGTNTVLMAVAERRDDGRFEVLAERAEVTRLGEGVDRSRHLSPEAIDRTAAAIARFADEARRLGVTAFVAGATSAARDAANAEELIATVLERAGIDLEILSGEAEARLTFRAVQEDFGTPEPAEGGPLCALDIGGGSTEVVLGPHRGAPTFHTSLDIGSVRLTERFVPAHPIPEAAQQALRARVREALQTVPSPGRRCEVVAVAATATNLYAVSRNPADADKEVHGGVLTVKTLEAWLPRLCAMSLEERRRLPGLEPRRADVICAGGWILLDALLHLGVDRCRVSDRGVRWGLLYERFGDRAAHA
ncbi:MAG: Ppx/GppA family phosphatase [Myxococcaceae bacterium]|nr:Ppx/GppA family phosphatase [Myxococcaceae bacterium]